MNTVDRILVNYRRQVRLPWSPGLAGKQRIWFVVYPPAEERRVRAKLEEFRAASLEAKRGWHAIDLTRLLPEWLAQHEYREAIFSEPHYLTSWSEIEGIAVEQVRGMCRSDDSTADDVVAVVGLGSLFDFIRVSRLLDAVEPDIRGRLVVFFPGVHQGNIYRFMDARDGFNYMAVPITSAESFI